MRILCVPVGVNQANCYLVHDDQGRTCVIDPGDEADRLLQVIEKESLDVEAVLVTHGHFDHVCGVKGLVEATGAPVYCGAETAAVFHGLGEGLTFGYPVPAVDAKAVRILQDGDELRVGDLIVKVLATPGHAPGSLTFEIDGHLFCGDLIFYRSVGRTDLPGGDFATLLASIEKLAEHYPASTPILPGHSMATSLGEELRGNPFLHGLTPHD